MTYGGYEFEGFSNCTTATYRNFALTQTAPFDTLKFYKRGKFVRQVTGANFKTIWQGLAVLEEQSGHINLYDLLNDSLLETNYGSYRVQDSTYLRMQGEGFWSYHDKNMKPCFQHTNGGLVYQNASFISRENGKQISLDSMGKISHSHSLGVRVHHGWYPAVVEEHSSQGYRLVLSNEYKTTWGWKNALWVNKGLIRMIGMKTDLMIDTISLDSFRIPTKWRIQRYAGLYKVRLKKKMGLLDAHGNMLFPPKYRDIRVSDNYIFLLEDTGWGLAQLDGKQLLDCVYLEISEIDGKLLLFNRKGSFGMSNVKGQKLLPARHKKIVVMGSVVKAFKRKGVTLYQLNEDLRFSDSLRFNQVINSTYENVSQVNKLISTKDTIALNPNLTGNWYYSKNYDSWRLYLENKEKSVGKHHHIEFPRYSRRLISYNYYIRPRTHLHFDKEYASDVTQGLFGRGDNMKIVPKSYVSVFGHDEARGSKRCLTPGGNFKVYIPDKEWELKFTATFIDTGFKCGYRVNFGGTWVSGDSVAFRPLANKYNFLSSCNLIDGKKAFNENWLKEQSMGLLGGTWLFMTPKGYISKKNRYQWIENCGKDYTIALVDDDWKLVRSPGSNPQYVFSRNKYLKRKKIGSKEYFIYSKKDSLYGYIDRNGVMIKPPAYSNCSTFTNGKLAVYEVNGWSFVDTGFTRVTPTEFAQVGNFGWERAPVKQGNFWGIINSDGKLIRNYNTYFMIRPYEDAYTWGVRRGGYYLLNTEGEEVLEQAYEAVTSVRYGRSLVAKKRKGKRALIDMTGKRLSGKRYQPVLNFNSDEVMIVKKGKRKYLLKSDGKKLLRKGFNKINPLQNGWYVAQHKQKVYAISRAGRLQAMPALYRYGKYFSEGMIAISLKDKHGFADTNGQILVTPSFKAVSDYSEGLALVQINGKKGACLDRQGRELFQFEGVFKSGFHNGLAIVKGSQGWYYLNTSGQNEFGTHYEKASAFVGDRAKIRRLEGWHLIDRNGRVLHEQPYYEIELTEEGALRIKELSGKGLLDYNLKPLIEPIMTRIQFVSDDVIRAEHYDKTYYYNLKDKSWIYRSFTE